MQKAHNPKIQTHILNSRLLQIQHYFPNYWSFLILSAPSKTTITAITQQRPTIPHSTLHTPRSKNHHPQTKIESFLERNMWLQLHTCSQGMTACGYFENGIFFRERDTMRRSCREKLGENWRGERRFGRYENKKVGTTGAGTRAANYWFNLLLFFVRKNGYIS